LLVFLTEKGGNQVSERKIVFNDDNFGSSHSHS